MRRKDDPWLPPAEYVQGNVYRIEGYHTGDFVGRLEAIDRYIAVLTVIDTLRPISLVKDRCAMPGCLLSDLHDGDHAYPPISKGRPVEVSWRAARLVLVENNFAPRPARGKEVAENRQSPFHGRGA